MLRFRFILLSLVAVFSVSAAVSSSAAALTDRYYEQPSEKALGTEKVEGSVGVAQFQSTLLGQKILIESTRNVFEEGQIEPEGKSSGKIKYENPVLYTVKEGRKEKAAGCEVKPIEFRFKDKLITQSKAGVVADEFEPVAPPTFVEIIIASESGKICSLKGTYKIQGTYTASLGDQAEEDQTEHELVFNEAGSSTVFESKSPAAYTNTVSKLKRTNGKEWYVD